MKRGVYIIVTFILVGCGYDRFSGSPEHYSCDELPNLSICELKELWYGDPVVVNENLIISGYVTSSDRDNNFYRTFFIEQDGHGVEVRAGLYDLHRTYHEGMRVVVKLRGTALGSDYGALQIGLKPHISSHYQTDYFGYKAMLEKYVSIDDRYRPPTAAEKRITELTDNECGSLVSIEDLLYKGVHGDKWAQETGPGEIPLHAYRIFEDNIGDTVAIYTSGYAAFAAETIPAGKISVTGILLHGKTDNRESSRMFILKPRESNDLRTENN